MTATREVTRFEFDLLRILRALLGVIPIDQVQSLILNKRTPPACLNPNAIALVKDTLSKGLILHLVRAGGWRDESFLHNDTPTLGRVWNRVPLAERTLTFSRKPLDFLLWLTARKVADMPSFWGSHPRVSSPPAAGSTLMTSAPSSPRDWPHSGPASTLERSTTRRPCRGRMVSKPFSVVDQYGPAHREVSVAGRNICAALLRIHPGLAERARPGLQLVLQKSAQFVGRRAGQIEPEFFDLFPDLGARNGRA